MFSFTADDIPRKPYGPDGAIFPMFVSIETGQQVKAKDSVSD